MSPWAGLEEQEDLRATIRRALDRAFPAEAAMGAAEAPGDFDEDASWRCAVELGLCGIGVAEDLGGGGGGFSDLGVAVSEFGYGLASGGFIGHVAAIHTLLTLGHFPASLLRALASGSARASMRLGLGAELLRIRADGPHLTVSGELVDVVEPGGVDWVVAVGERGGPPELVALRTAGPGVSIELTESYDPTRRFGRVSFDSAPVEIVFPCERVPGSAAEDSAGLIGSLLVAFDSVGNGRRSLDQAVSYARERRQFGSPIGAFQAIKHLLVDAHLAVEHAGAACEDAADALDCLREDHRLRAHMAKALAGDAHNLAAGTGVQVHGGMGFTRSVPSHLFVKRARVNEHLCGTPREHRRVIAVSLSPVLEAWSSRPIGSDDA